MLLFEQVANGRPHIVEDFQPVGAGRHDLVPAAASFARKQAVEVEQPVGPNADQPVSMEIAIWVLEEECRSGSLVELLVEPRAQQAPIHSGQQGADICAGGVEAHFPPRARIAHIRIPAERQDMGEPLLGVELDQVGLEALAIASRKAQLVSNVSHD
jgi:hypothetical protein